MATPQDCLQKLIRVVPQFMSATNNVLYYLVESRKSVLVIHGWTTTLLFLQKSN